MSSSPSWRSLLGQLAVALTPRVVRAPTHVPTPTQHELDQTAAKKAPPSPPTIEPAAQPVSHTAKTMARGLGLALTQDTRQVARTGQALTLAESVNLHDLSGEGRALITAELLAARLILDHKQADWHPELERPKVPEKAYQKKDIPSSYGDRVPRLVPAHTRQRIAELLGEEHLLHERFDEHFDVIFVLEVGKYQHLMTHEAASAAHLEHARIIEDARYTLFYQSYKIKPERQTHPWGKSRLYITREGLGATRALLLPDFDIQATREQGFASIISRDALLTVEPSSPNDRDAARAWCITYTNTLRDQERYPYIMGLIPLTS